MATLTRALRPLALLALAPALMAGNCRKPPPEEPDIVDATPRDITESLSVVAVSPSSGPSGQAFDVTVRGAAFEQGAKVFIGSQPGTNTVVQSDRAIGTRTPVLEPGRYDVEVINPDGKSAVLRQGLSVAAASLSCEKVTVYFALDVSSLDGTAVNKLTQELDCLKTSASPIRIEGHADERGTTDYNLALGERRANAVSSWLKARGVSGSRLDTVSYGEERPAEYGSSEAAWAKNRRAEVLLAR